MKEEIKEILNYLTKFINDKEEITKYGCEISVKQAKQLLDYITNLQEENERLNNIIDLIKNNIDITIQIIKEQPTENDEFDKWILERLNGIKNIGELKGE